MNSFKPHSATHLLNYLLWIFALFPLIVNAQNEPPKKVAKALEKADNYYHNAEFSKAVEFYLDAFERMPDRYSAEQLAYSYTLMNEPETAVFWFEKAEEQSEEFSPDFIIKYALALMETGEQDYAREKFQEYNSFLESDNPLVYKYLASIEHRGRYFEDSVYFRMASINLNTPLAEFLPYYDDGILMFLQSHQNKDFAPLANSAVIQVAQETQPDVFKLISEVDKGKYLTGSVLSFSMVENSSDIYLTNNQPGVNASPKYVLNRGVLTSKYELASVEPVLIDGYAMNIMHATISPEGKRLVFTSDAPGGFGGFDIYEAWLVNNQFTNVRNLGPSVNSSEDELFPYLQNDSILYFSSIGHGGLGGYDLYRANINKPLPKITNLGYPVNSTSDDYNICFVDDLTGYISSARAGDDNMYKLHIKAIRFTTTIIDEASQKNIKNVDISMIPEVGQVQDLALADNGKLELLIPPESKFRLEVRKPGYETRHTDYDASSWILSGLHSFNAHPIRIEKLTAGSEVGKGTEPDMPVDPAIKTEEAPLVPVVVPITVTNTEPAASMNESVAETFDEPIAEEQAMVNEPEPETTIPIIEPEVIPIQHTKPGIVFRLQIAASRRPLQPSTLQNKYKGKNKVYMFQEEGWYKYAIGDFETYYQAKKNRKICGVPDAFVAAYRGTEKLVLSEAIREVLQYEQQTSRELVLKATNNEVVFQRMYYYDTDKAELSVGDLSKLDPFIDSLKIHPNYYIEVTGYTDSRGGSLYNKALSMERAQNIRQYFVRNGIESKRIGIFGFGSSGSVSASSSDRKVIVVLKSRN